MNFFAFGGGRIVFAGLPGFLNTAGDPAGFSAATFQVSVGDPVTSITQPTIEAFGQDEWRVNSRLSINLGARYTVDLLPQEMMDRDYNNLQPRVGAVYSFGSQHATVVRAGYGVFVNTFPILQHMNPRCLVAWLPSHEKPVRRAGADFVDFRRRGDGRRARVSEERDHSRGRARSLGFRPTGSLPTRSHSRPTSRSSANLSDRSWRSCAGYVHTAGRNLNRIQNINLLPPVALLPSGKPHFQFARPIPHSAPSPNTTATGTQDTTAQRSALKSD